MEITARVVLNEIAYQADLTKGIDLSVAVSDGPNQVNAYYADPVTMQPYKSGHWIGSVAEGGGVNYRNIFFNPHGHGSHTECRGHITKEIQSINATFQQWHLTAQVISVLPVGIPERGQVIERSAFVGRLVLGVEALIIRTLGNLPQRITQKWSGSDPPYLHPSAVEYMVEHGIEHVLIDLPSLDREVDGGLLSAHNALWNLSDPAANQRTITELIRVPDLVKDGPYLLNLQVAPFENDAAPSRPVVFDLVPEL